MNTQPQHDILFLAGQITGIILIVLLPILFGFFLYKYHTTKQKKYKVMSWIVGVPTSIFFLLVLVGVVFSIFDAIERRKAKLPHDADSVRTIIGEKWGIVKGEKWNYGISVPKLKYWRVTNGVGDVELEMRYRGLSLNIIPEKVEIDSKVKMLEIIKRNVKREFGEKGVQFIQTSTTVIDKEEWLIQDAEIFNGDMKVTYRWYLFTGYGKSIQLLFIAPPEEFIIQEKLIEKIAKTFIIGV